MALYSANKGIVLSKLGALPSSSWRHCIQPAGDIVLSQLGALYSASWGHYTLRALYSASKVHCTRPSGEIVLSKMRGMYSTMYTASCGALSLSDLGTSYSYGSWGHCTRPARGWACTDVLSQLGTFCLASCEMALRQRGGGGLLCSASWWAWPLTNNFRRVTPATVGNHKD